MKVACVSGSGCYISKCVYYRTGEKSLDCYYRPYHRVEYYRYVRFFPEGKINDICCMCFLRMFIRSYLFFVAILGWKIQTAWIRHLLFFLSTHAVTIKILYLCFTKIKKYNMYRMWLLMWSYSVFHNYQPPCFIRITLVAC